MGSRRHAPKHLDPAGRGKGTGPMTRELMMLEEIRAARPKVGRGKVASTTEEDIGRHQVEDGEDPDAPLPPLRPSPDVRAIGADIMVQQTAASPGIIW